MFGPGRQTILGTRTSLSPVELSTLTARLVGGYDPATSGGPLSPEEIFRWVQILDDAKYLELMQAPSPGDYIRSIGSVSIAVLGLGLCFTGPILLLALT
jgi:hypothetical protein